MPGGMYRNQFWLPFPDRNVLLCLGIHGQMVYANCDTGLVGAKLSSWPEPQNATKLFSALRAFDAIAAARRGVAENPRARPGSALAVDAPRQAPGFAARRPSGSKSSGMAWYAHRTQPAPDGRGAPPTCRAGAGGRTATGRRG